jgi:hypothetical protein
MDSDFGATGDSGFPKWRPPYVGEILTVRGVLVRVMSVDIDEPTNPRYTGFTVDYEPISLAGKEISR